VAVYFFKSVAEKTVPLAKQRFESALWKTEELHRVVPATATTIDSDLRTQRIEMYSEFVDDD
jgi:hypothetical protein